MPAQAAREKTYTGALTMLTALFFMWGLITVLNDILIPHLKSIYTLNYAQVMMVQFCFFGAYFVMSVPAGMLIRRIGYQSGVVTGLLIAAAGCGLFFPASQSGFSLFLLALFVLASGITILQVAANPYVTVLGPSATASSRLTMTQAFNSLGTAIGPYLGGMFILAGVTLTAEQLQSMSAAEQAAHRATEAATVQGPYLALAGTLVALAVLFAFARLPKIDHADDDVHPDTENVSLFSYKHLVLGVVGIFAYVGAEVSIGSFLISFMGESYIAGLSHSTAANYLTYYWMGAMVGRFIGAWVMRTVSPGKTLAFNAACSITLILAAIFIKGPLAMWALLAVGLFNSIMFPTIFSMALHGLGRLTSQGSGALCMAIVGGAIVPLAQGVLADSIGLQLSFFLPVVCYAFILFYGVKYAGLHKAGVTQE